jgi:hypothetical protein
MIRPDVAAAASPDPVIGLPELIPERSVARPVKNLGNTCYLGAVCTYREHLALASCPSVLLTFVPA